MFKTSLLPILILSLTSLAQAKDHDHKSATSDNHKSHHSHDTHGAHSSHEDGVSPDQAMTWLKNGNKRFVKGHFRKDGRGPADIKRLLAGQKPHTIVLSCADSRVPPEHVFDQGLGEIFVVRVAGEALDNSVIASMEYAVEHLGAKNIMVMGHTHCGAVKAALAAKDGQTNGSPSLDALVADIKPRLPASATDPAVETESGLNAKGIAKDLLTRSKIIRERVESGKAKVSSSMYFLKDGHVEFHEN